MKTTDFSILLRIVKLAKPYRFVFWSCAFLAIILAPLNAIRPYLINVMVDDYIMVFDAAGLLQMALILIGLIFLQAVLQYIFIYSTRLLGNDVIRDLRIRVFKHISSFPMSYFDKTPIGQSTTRTINDVETINTVFSQGLMTIFADLVSVVAVLAIMSYTSWRLTVICLITMPALMLATYIFKEKIKNTFQVVRNQVSNMNSFLQEHISGMRVVQIFNREKQEAEKFKTINRSYTQANLNAVLYYAVFFPVVELIHYTAIGLMIWWGAKGYIESTVTMGSLVVFPIYINMLFRPIRMLADKFNTLQMGMVAGERVFNILDDSKAISDQGRIIKKTVRGKIEFDHVRFSYKEGYPVLSDLSFTVRPGQTLAIVGATGSGKSTIINLLYRFYDFDTGAIRIDNLSIRDYEIENLRSHIGLVLQDIFLFTGSIMDNITLKNPEITEAQVYQASKMIGAHAYLAHLPEGYYFEVQERGENLSMGQRQLISFIRALVYNPSILILDEATSSIDVETEAIIQHAIETLIAKRTSLVIAHRLSTIRNADNIMVLDQGKLVEIGTHDELILIKNGYYSRLYQKQLETTLI